MALEELELEIVATEPSERVARFLAAVDARLEQMERDGLHTRLPSFAPAAHAPVHDVLAALARSTLRGERFLEWGSALGAAAGMAAALGFRASGIEIDHELAAASRELLSAHGLHVDIAEGSFVPEGHEVPADLDDPDTDTLREGLPAYDLLDRDLDEFAIVYAYPWPDMRDAFLDLFDRHASRGALLVTYQSRDGVAVHRKV